MTGAPTGGGALRAGVASPVAAGPDGGQLGHGAEEDAATGGGAHGLPQALRVLVVDDERLSRETAVHQLTDAGYVARAVDDGYAALDALASHPWDVVLCDLRMPGLDGVELLRTIRQEHVDVDVIVMTAYGTVETAVAAIKAGAADYLTKPFSFRELEHRLQKLDELRGFRRELSGLRALLNEAEEPCCGIVGQSPAMRELTQLLRTFAQHDAPVLVTGETGTGKEKVARALHQLGPRARAPFIPVACGAIPQELAESALLGHERGAFTGATGQRFGAFERADGGTLLLDDIDDLPLGLQVKLLRALEEKKFVRVGGSREIEVDTRVVATSKVDLDESAERGEFRRDLYYRLRALEVRLPPLRERGEDILLLAEHFIRQIQAGEGTGEVTLGPAAAACLRRHRWPGNVRELRHAMESAVIVCAGGTITPECLPDYLRAEEAKPSDEPFTLQLTDRDSVGFNDCVRAFEDQLLRWAMRRAHGQQKKAAKLLGLPRTTLQSKLRRLGDEGAGSGGGSRKR